MLNTRHLNEVVFRHARVYQAHGLWCGVACLLRDALPRPGRLVLVWLRLWALVFLRFLPADRGGVASLPRTLGGARTKRPLWLFSQSCSSRLCSSPAMAFVAAGAASVTPFGRRPGRLCTERRLPKASGWLPSVRTVSARYTDEWLPDMFPVIAKSSTDWSKLWKEAQTERNAAQAKAAAAVRALQDNAQSVLDIDEAGVSKLPQEKRLDLYWKLMKLSSAGAATASKLAWRLHHSQSEAGKIMSSLLLGTAEKVTMLEGDVGESYAIAVASALEYARLRLVVEVLSISAASGVESSATQPLEFAAALLKARRNRAKGVDLSELIECVATRSLGDVLVDESELLEAAVNTYQNIQDDRPDELKEDEVYIKDPNFAALVQQKTVLKRYLIESKNQERGSVGGDGASKADVKRLSDAVTVKYKRAENALDVLFARASLRLLISWVVRHPEDFLLVYKLREGVMGRHLVAQLDRLRLEEPKRVDASDRVLVELITSLETLSLLRVETCIRRIRNRSAHWPLSRELLTYVKLSPLLRENLPGPGVDEVVELTLQLRAAQLQYEASTDVIGHEEVVKALSTGVQDDVNFVGRRAAYIEEVQAARRDLLADKVKVMAELDAIQTECGQASETLDAGRWKGA